MCERAREWASLRLDDELSEFEGALLDAHLRRCADCASYVLESGAVTAAIRGSELELLPRPVAMPLRHRRGYAGLVLQAGAAAAAIVALTIGLGTQFGPSRSSPTAVADAARSPASMVTSGPNSEDDMLVRLPRLVNLKAQLGFGRPRGLRIDA